MARVLQVLSLFFKCGGMSAANFTFTHCSVSFNKSVSSAWTGRIRAQREITIIKDPRRSGESYDEDPDLEEKVRAFLTGEKKKQRTVTYHIIKRQMSSPEPPERKLTWDAMEQIRYLKKEQPEEWTVQRLAEGFSVTPDVILRVLGGTFIPSPARKAKQDANVMKALSQLVLSSGAWKAQEMPKLPKNHKPVTPLSENREDALVPVSDQNLMIQHKGLGSLVKSPVLVKVLPTQFASGITKPSIIGDITDNTNLEENDESWDGKVFTEEELEELMEMEKPSPVMQIGKEFFDAEGNFLYRI